MKFETAAKHSEKGCLRDTSSHLKLRTLGELDILFPIHRDDSFDRELDDVLGDSLAEGLDDDAADAFTARRSTVAECLISHKFITPFVVEYARRFECVGWKEAQVINSEFSSI